MRVLSSIKEHRDCDTWDDFTLLGDAEDPDWFRTQISSRYSVKFRGSLGPRKGSDKGIRILNRVIQWEDNARVYEADQ